MTPSLQRTFGGDVCSWHGSPTDRELRWYFAEGCALGAMGGGLGHTLDRLKYNLSPSGAIRDPELDAHALQRAREIRDAFASTDPLVFRVLRAHYAPRDVVGVDVVRACLFFGALGVCATLCDSFGRWMKKCESTDIVPCVKRLDEGVRKHDPSALAHAAAIRREGAVMLPACVDAYIAAKKHTKDTM